MDILIATNVVLGTMLLAAIGIAVYYGLRVRRFVRASHVAVDNNTFCQPQEGPCELVVNSSLRVIEPITPVFSYATARYCTDLIARIELLFYKKNGLRALVMAPGLTLVRELHYRNKIIGYVARSEAGTVWVAFRGTADKWEWRQDFTFSQVNLETDPEGDQRPLQTKAETLACHSGFMTVFQSFREVLVAAIREINPTGPIVLCGHSLGAALATLSGIELNNFFSDVIVYTFGSPRVCDTIPSSLVLFRVVNSNDPITTVPLSVMPNINRKNAPFFYQHGGTEIMFTDNRFSLTNNHLLPVYIQELDRHLSLGQ
jgi:triacylglycerol lipase